MRGRRFHVVLASTWLRAELESLEPPVMAETIFSKIIRREIPAEIVYEDEHCLAFRDIQPQAPVHVLLIPKKEIPSLADVTAEDLPLLGHLQWTLRNLAQELQLEKGYRVIVNCGAEGGQSVDHLHYHLLGGRRLSWPPG
jgi:histidine triad (HIT) family protein